MLKVEQNEQRSCPTTGITGRQTAAPDLFLCEVGRGTPAGEYQRRFWQPVCYISRTRRGAACACGRWARIWWSSRT